MQLFDKNGNVLMSVDPSKSIASGGEGSILEHPKDRSKVIKIYHTVRDTKLETALIELNRLPSGFIKPEEIYYDVRGKIAGFSMRYIDMSKHWVLKHLFTNSFCIQNGIDRSFKYKIYSNLKTLVEGAHAVGVVIGDLNPYNILVSKTGDVVMIDVDSYGTTSKPHNGILLEDVRDWLQHPRIDRTTDAYAFDVLSFWMFTFLHPFRGDYPPHKNLEERVCKKSSVLSGLNITIPKCYQPFTNQAIIDQFRSVFQDGKRFFVDMTGQPVMVGAVSSPVVVGTTDLAIRSIEKNIEEVRCTNNLLAYRKNGTWTILNVANYGAYSKVATVDGDVYLGNKNFIYLQSGKMWHNGVELKNVQIPLGASIFSDNGSVFVCDVHDNYQLTLSIDSIMSGQILMDRKPIYGKSLTFGDSVIQNIGTDKWLLSFNGNMFNLIKSGLHLKNAYVRNGYGLFEHIRNNKVGYTLGKLNGLKIEFGSDLSDFRYFDVKGGFLFIPADGKIDMINPVNNWKIVSSIDCPVCTEQSKIFHVGAGMVVQSGDELWLVNRKQV